MKNALLTAKLLLFFAVFVTNSVAQKTKASGDEDVSDVPRKVSVTTGKTALSMDLFNKKPVLNVKINGKGPFKFFLDTGAGGTVLNQDLADELKLPTGGTVKIGDPADPQAVTANRNTIDKLEIGGATFSDLMAVSFDRSSLSKEGAPRGVLGMPLFQKVLLTIDYPKKRIEIAQGKLPVSNGANVIDYRPSEGGIFEVSVKIGSESMQATVDTGSQSGMTFPPDYMDKLSLDGKPVEAGRGRTVAGDAIIYAAKLKSTVRLGGYSFDDQPVTFFGRLRQLNLGYGFLNQFALTIDQENHRMKFDRPQTLAKAADTPIVRAPSSNGDLAEYAGLYGERRLTVDNGELYLQRIAGPMGEGQKIKLAGISKDAFGMAGSQQVRLKFIRNAGGEITEIQVLTQAGEWETSKKGK